MSTRELLTLGTSSLVPSKSRNHNGYFLRWGAEGILFDCGEGTQRQMTFAGLSARSITTICIMHFHGDHCLGLPGVLQRISLDRREMYGSFWRKATHSIWRHKGWRPEMMQAVLNDLEAGF